MTSVWSPIAARTNATIAVVSASLGNRLGTQDPNAAPAVELPRWARMLDDLLAALDPTLHAAISVTFAGFEAEIEPARLCVCYEDCEQYGAALELLLANAARQADHTDSASDREESVPAALLGTTVHCELDVPFSIAALCLDFAAGFPHDAEMRLVADHLRATNRVTPEILDGILRAAADHLAVRDPVAFAALCGRFPSCTARFRG